MDTTRSRRRIPIYRLYIPVVSRIFPNASITLPRVLSLSSFIQFVSSKALYMLGPVLILVTSGLLYSLSYTYWKITIPLKFHSYSTTKAIIHQIFVAFILINISFNYLLCVTTRNFPGANYEQVVRQLARATGFDYPENEVEIENWKSSWREMILERSKQKRLRDRQELNRKHDVDGDVDEELGMSSAEASGESNNNPGPGVSNSDIKRRTGIQPRTPGRAWMWLGPHDWSYDDRTRRPKPPRAHFDNVTRALVLNMDHYCPWMFNTVGYFNYRYFCNFLIYTSVGMAYGAIASFHLFMMIDSVEYHDQISESRKLYLNATETTGEDLSQSQPRPSFKYSKVQHLIPGIPTPTEAMPIAFSFMICLAVGLSVMILMVFHLFLISTAQTTIEFHANLMKKARCRERGEIYRNPYNFGIRRNFEQVWGRWHGGWYLFWVTLLPSFRQPEYLPVPLDGDKGRRENWN